jgi:ferredoxin
MEANISPPRSPPASALVSRSASLEEESNLACPCIVQLSEAVTQPKLGSPELPTKGSVAHPLAQCTPCGFFHKGGCYHGVNCKFCHLCVPSEIKQRKKQKRQFLGAMKAWHREVSANMAAHLTQLA